MSEYILMGTPFAYHDFSAISALLPSIVGGITWKRQSVAHRFLVVLSAISLITDVAGTFSIWWYGNNVSLVNGYLLLQSLITGLFFINLKEVHVSLHPIRMAIFWIMCLVSLILLFTGPFVTVINKWQLSASSFFIIVFSCLYFYNLVRYELEIPIWIKASFYAVMALMLYYVTNMVLFLTIDDLQPESIYELWNLKLTGYIVLNIFITVAFLLEYKDSYGR